MAKNTPYRHKKEPKRTKKARIIPLIAQCENVYREKIKRDVSGSEADYETQIPKKRATKQHDDSVKVAAEVNEVSKSMVYMVRYGEREHEGVVDTLVEYNTRRELLISDLKRKRKLFKLAEKMGKVEEIIDLEEVIDRLRDQAQAMIDQLTKEMEQTLLGHDN